MAIIKKGGGKGGSSWGGKGKGGGGWGGGKGKGGGGGGTWVFMPVQTPFRSKGFGKSGGKKGGGKGKKGGKRGEMKPFSELSDERKEEIRMKHEEKHAEQGREPQGDTFYFGELIQRGKRYGWIKPSAFGKLPSEVQAKVKEMVNAKRKTVKESGSTNDVFKNNVLFLHMSDVDEGVKVEQGCRVKFKVYTDNEGAGACEVTTA